MLAVHLDSNPGTASLFQRLSTSTLTASLPRPNSALCFANLRMTLAPLGPPPRFLASHLSHSILLQHPSISTALIDTSSDLPDVHSSKVTVVPAHTDLNNMSSSTSQQVDDAARQASNNVQQGARNVENSMKSGSRDFERKADQLGDDIKSGAKDLEKK